MNLYCNNYATCNQVMVDRGSVVLTKFAATLRGWYLYHGKSETGKLLDVTLCANCYGKRRRQDPAPEALEGQLELFEEDEPVADVQQAFDEGTKLQTRSPDEQGTTGTSPGTGCDPAS